MRWEPLALCAFLLAGCTTAKEQPAPSSTHQWLDDFRHKYRKSWTSAPNEVRRLITQDYQQRLIAFITGKNYVLDSIRVKVGRMEAKGDQVFTEFRGPGILFHDAIDSPEEVANPRVRLKEGRDTILSFKCLGPAELSPATDPFPVRIEATPLR
jgi:hypothetical protein